MSQDFIWNIFIFPEMLAALKNQKMHNHANTWNHQTTKIILEKCGEHQATKETQL